MTLCTPNVDKARIREGVVKEIASLSADEKKRQSQIVYQKVINHPQYMSSSRIALYLSTEQEVDTAPIIQHALSRGILVHGPQYAGGNMQMKVMGSGKNVTTENEEAGGLDLIITPGLAFSASGARLGHGGGYYDRYLAKARESSNPFVLALAFACQIKPEGTIPMMERDQFVDEVISAS